MRGRPWQVMLLLVLFAWLMPQVAWADDKLETAFIVDKSYYVLRSAADWDKFRQLVMDANGNSDVNAIMDANFSINQNSCVGMDAYPYNGTFNGNGHTLTVDVNWGSNYYAAPFPSVGNATFKNLTIKGKVIGGKHTGGLVGHAWGSSQSITLENIIMNASVSSQSTHAGGIVGHADKAKLTVIDVASTAKIWTSGSDTYGGAIIGWANNGGSWTFHRVWEGVEFNSTVHCGFCYYFNSGAIAWGYNDQSSNCLSFHNWGEMKAECRSKGNDDATELFNQEQPGSWYDGYPVMDTWPAAGDVNFETYDMVPGTEDTEKGTLKIPFSCDKPVKYIDVSYSGRTLSRITFKEDTYAGFIPVPATEQHKSLTIKAKLVVGTVTVTRKDEDDAVLHKPENLTASVLKYGDHNVLTDAGAVEMKWTVSSPEYKDIISGDEFMVMRSLTGKDEDYQVIGSVTFDENTTNYTYKDSTLVSALTAEQINGGGSVTPYYCVVRASAYQLWGMSYTVNNVKTDNPAMAKISTTLSGLHTLKVNTDYEADWEDAAARTIHVTWNYANESGAVWDDRAQMKLLITTVNRNNEPVDSVYHTLTAEEVTACRKVVQLTRSCVYYNIEFVTELGSTVTHYRSKDQLKDKFITINTTSDWNTFVIMVTEAQGKYGVNAWLMADISVENQAGIDSNAPYRGTFEGNGHTLTVNITGNQQCNAPFRYVINAIIRNLHTAGTITTSQKFAGGLVSRVLDNASLLVEGCHVSVDINSSVSGDATNGGIVALGNNGTTITLRNSKFDGKLRGDNCHSNGGMVGYSTGQVNIESSLFAPAEISTKTDGCQTWARIGGSGKLTTTNCQSTREYVDGYFVYEGCSYLILRNASDWKTFRQRVKDAKGSSPVYAIMAADFTVTTMVGESESEAFYGTFNGNGHTLTVNIDNGNNAYAAPFSHVGSGAITNLHVAGSVKGGIHSSGLVGSVVNNSNFNIRGVWVSADITTTSTHLGGFIGHGGSPFNPLAIVYCRFDGSLNAPSGTGLYGGAFIGWVHEGAWGIDFSYENGTYNNIEHAGFSYWYDGSPHAYSYPGCVSSHDWDEVDASRRNITEENKVIELFSGYSALWQIVDGKAVPNMEIIDVPDPTGPSADDLLAALGDGWTKDANGKPVPKTSVSQPVGDDVPSGQFYYESLGQIVTNSLQTETHQSSVMLTWEKTEDTVDYFRVERRNVTTDEKWDIIAPQVTEQEYEDKTVSPVFDYEYCVSSVNDCEGLHVTTSGIKPGNCVKTGKVEGYVRFADGSGIPGIRVSVSPFGDGADPTMGGSCVTDESGFYSVEKLPYWGFQKGEYTATVSGIARDDLSADCQEGLPVTFTAQSNYQKGRNFTVVNGVKFSGLVMYQGTSIPVKGTHFQVDGREVRTAGGAVETDFEGKFSFRMLRGQHKVKAVMKGHTFADKGLYLENNDSTINFQTDVANTYFYDTKQVKLIGRVAGGHVQGQLPLGNSLSTNNLGDSLKVVLTLEGDNASWLVFDNTNRALTTRDTVYTHKKHDQIDQNEYATRVHTERHRMVVYPDKHTGEYEVLLPPVKWKIQQITAEGYATLFQDGQTSDVIDLTDSLTLHTDIFKGKWKSHGGVEVTQAVEEYHAKYSRIYHSPVLLEYKQQGYDAFDYFGEKNFSYQPIKGVKQQIPVAYSVKKPNWPKERKDSLETRYTFGYPVFSTDRSYGLKLSALERYYYNNNMKSDTVDVVKLDGGFVTIRNGLMSGTQRDTLSLDSIGEGNYTLRADRTPYLLTGTGALCTVTFTMERDGTTFEGTPLRGYVFSAESPTGAQDIVSVGSPVLVDILRDPPGGGSSATLSKGSTLRLAYQMDMSWKGGVSIGINAGSGQDFYTGIWSGMGIGANYGQVGHASSVFNTSIDIVFSGSGQRAFAYTMTANENISTDAGTYMVGADADLYMGMETNMFIRPAVAIQAISDSAFVASGGALKAGRMVEIASGRDAKDSLFHLVRSEVLAPGQRVTSTFVHSQQYLVNQLIPGLVSECRSQMFTGSLDDAQSEANRRNQRIYLSLVPETDEERFGVVNTDKKGNYVYHTSNDNYKAADASQMNYVIVLPKGDDGKVQTDTIHALCNTIGAWTNMIARNEKEKLQATDLMKNFDVDGGGTVSYSEEFSTEYSNTSSYNWLGTDFTHNYFANPDPSNPDAYGDNERAQAAFSTIMPLLGNTVAKFLTGMFAKTSLGGSSVKDVEKIENNWLADYKISFVGLTWNFGLTPVAAYGMTPKNSETTKYSRKESFTVKMDKKSHMDFDVYYSRIIDTSDDIKADGKIDIFYETNFLNNVDYMEYFLDRSVGSRKIVDQMVKPRGFIYRTRGGATVRPWEPERKTLFERTGTTLDERTKKIENPIIKIDRQSVSGVPHDNPARFKLYMTNESEQPEAVSGSLLYYTLYLESKSNPKGARMTVDGIPLSADGTTVRLEPGEVTEKTLEVWAGEDFDYDDLQIGLISQGDVMCYDVVNFSVHYLPTAGNIEIASPGDKWIMNCDAPSDAKQGWYLPVIINGFNKNQKNFDHIEFQYKEATRGDDYWTNLCGYYADSTLYAAATGTKAMIPENGNIVAKFYGEGTVMEKAYDLRARLFRRNGNSFITSDTKVLTGIKDTRRPQLFGQPDPKDGIIGAGDNIVFHFSEAIEHNYLQQATNFEVVGETNETALSEEPALFFEGNGYVQTDARRNFADKNMTIDLMVRPDQTNKDMPIFSHGQDGSTLQLWLTNDWRLRAVIDSVQFESTAAVKQGAMQQVALVLDNDNKQVLLWNDSIIGTKKDVTYSGYGPLIFGATNEVTTSDRKHYSGRMMEARIWNRAMNESLLNTYGKRQLTGYEMGLIDYYPMNDGEGNYAVDKAQGANAELHGATWVLPRGMSLKLDWAEQKAVKGLQLDYTKMLRSAEQDYTLMLWFKTDNEGQGALISNGKGEITDDDARNKFFLGFEKNQLIYRTNGRTLPLGKGLADDQWHHFAITVDRSHQVANLYVDRVLTQSISTDTLGGMMGQDFYVGNMVWHEAGAHVQTLHQENALAGHIDELCLFSQALPHTLLKHYSSKCPTGREKGLLVRMGFGRHERQSNNNIELRPFALNQVVKFDMDGNPTEEHDSVFVEPVADILAHIDQHVGAPVQFNQELNNLKFSFVGRDNQLLVNIDELDSRINKRNLYVTVTDIPDLNGNYMASPATMEFYVDRNPLRWQVKRLTHEFTSNSYTDQDDILTVSISNTSGANHTYTIDNMPRWMTVDRQTDIIGPQSEQLLVFTIAKDLNVGTYDEVIYLTDENNLSEPLALTVRKEGVEPDWYVADELKHFSMNLVGQVKIGNAIVTDSKDKVAAFDSMNRCLGMANVSYNATTGKSQLFMTLFSDQSNMGNTEVTFKLWHHQTGQVMVLEPDRTVTFKHSTVVGTVDDPVVMTGGSTYYQELNLRSGWNWISLNVDNKEYRDVIGMLNKYSWQDGDIVTDDTEDFTLVYKASLGTWLANNSQKSSYTVSPKRSYRVYVKNNVNIEIKGYPLRDESQRTLKVQHGWNNIGYTPMVNLPVATALADYTGAASNGDVVKSREEFAIFTETSVGGGYWSGSLQYLKPGEGYMLYRNSDGEAQFRYPFYEPGSNFFERTAQSRAASADYGHNMSVVATVRGFEVQEGDRIIAFADGEQRGEAQLSTLNTQPSTLNTQPSTGFFLTIMGDKKVPLCFAIERDGEIVAATAEVMGYESNAVSGSLMEPTVIQFVKTDYADGNWYTVHGLRLGGKPSRPGVYIHNGKKQIVK